MLDHSTQEESVFSPLSLDDAFHPTWIEINLSQLKHNIQLIQKKIRSKKFCLPIKANAYGHGLYRVAQEAIACGVDYLAVSSLQEGVFLRKKGIAAPILVLGAVSPNQLHALVAHHLEFSLHSPFKAKLVADYCLTHRVCVRVHLKIDSGMRRLGVWHERALDFFSFVARFPCFSIVGVFSHFATAETPNHPFVQLQLQRFDKTMQTIQKYYFKPFIRHIANSGAVCHYPSSYYDMVRPGLMTFGYLPPQTNKREWKGLCPCLSLKSRIAFFKVIEPGEGIGYDLSHIATEKTRIVTIPIGYGDGFSRQFSNRGQVLIRGKRYPIVGRISMDQLTVDIGLDEAFVGEEVVLIGQQGKHSIEVTELADLAQTIPYEVLVSLSSRIPRLYTR